MEKSQSSTEKVAKKYCNLSIRWITSSGDCSIHNIKKLLFF